MASAELVVFGQLVGQTGNMREEMFDCHLVPVAVFERRDEFFERVIEFELAAIEKGHQSGHGDGFGDRAEKEHGVRGLSFAKRAGEGGFALNDVPDPGAVTLQVTRAGKPLPPARLDLPKGWRRHDISWRPSQGSVPPIIGIWEEPLKPEQKKARGIETDRLALRVSFLFPGEKWVATRGGLKLNDVITGVNGQALPHMTPRQFHSYFRFNFNVGDTATLNVLRGDQKLEIKVPCMDVGEE